jgi:chromosome partitioning protein
MVMTTSSWKGGTGKTTLNVVTATFLAMRGKRVLLIDLDSNCALSQCFGQIMKDFTSMEFLSGNVEGFAGIYRAGENIDIIPGNIKNILLNNIMDTQLKIALKRSGLLERYDFIIIDPPGTWGAHTRNAVFAADTLIIPGTCSRIDYEATALYFQTLRDCCFEGNALVCINAYNKKTALPGIVEEYRARFGEYLMPEPIPYIQSLKKLTADVSYPVHPSVKKRLEAYVDYITGGHDA